jgi:serine protease Do
MNLQTASVEESASTEGNGAYLGIMGVDVDALNAVQYHMPQGIFVARVISGTGADKAGLQKKDVITALNQTRVTSMEELQSLLASYNVGDTVELTVARYANNYTEETVKVVLSKAE